MACQKDYLSFFIALLLLLLLGFGYVTLVWVKVVTCNKFQKILFSHWIISLSFASRTKSSKFDLYRLQTKAAKPIKSISNLNQNFLLVSSTRSTLTVSWSFYLTKHITKFQRRSIQYCKRLAIESLVVLFEYIYFRFLSYFVNFHYYYIVLATFLKTGMLQV